MSDRKEFGFGFSSTAEEVSAGVDLTGRRAIVTGGASGIGVETARVLALRGAEVTIPARDLAAAEKVAAGILASTGNKVLVAHLDLADQASIRRFVADWTGPVHLLVANAGVMAPPLTRTNDGWELQFATNHLGHFTLVTGLHDALAAEGARVVVVSSVGHLRSDIHYDDLHFEQREYTPFGAYGQSKTANILFAVEADRRWRGDGIRVNALMPGAIQTNLARHVDMAELERLRAEVNMPFRWKSIEQGAATQVLVATSPLVEGIGGEYFEDCAIAAPAVPDVYAGVAAYAKDPANAARLWDVSGELTAA